MPQQKYDMPDAMLDSLGMALLRLKTEDEYTDRALADMVPGVSRSRINQLTSDETGLTRRGALGVVYALAGALWQRGNTRLVDVLKPDDVVFACTQDLGHTPDGCPHEEAAGGHDALTDWRRAILANDPDAATQALTEYEENVPKMRNETAHLRQRMEGGTATLHVRGDGMPEEPAMP